jgi:signal transduction histidine kinase
MDQRGAVFNSRQKLGALFAAQIAIFSVLWVNALWIVDDVRVASSSSHYVFNVRLALWLYSVEFAVDLFQRARTQSSFSHAQILREAAWCAALIVLNLVFRWALVIALTWAFLNIPTPFGFLPYIAAILPSVVWQLLVPILGGPKPSGSDNLIRGSKVFTFEEAKERLSERVAKRRHKGDGA